MMCHKKQMLAWPNLAPDTKSPPIIDAHNASAVTMFFSSQSSEIMQYANVNECRCTEAQIPVNVPYTVVMYQ